MVQWHRQGFRLYWRWRSRSGRRPISGQTRKLVREMCFANPLWGAPRIHGELLKLGIEISQATVAKYMVRRPHSPSPTWRSFLRNQALGIAAIDMFIVPSATFRLLFVMLILAHDRRKIVYGWWFRSQRMNRRDCSGAASARWWLPTRHPSIHWRRTSHSNKKCRARSKQVTRTQNSRVAFPVSSRKNRPRWYAAAVVPAASPTVTT